MVRESDPQYHDCPFTRPQLTTGPRVPQQKCLLTALGVCSQCVCIYSLLTAVCVHFDGINLEHKF